MDNIYINLNELISFLSSNRDYLCKEYNLTKIGVFGSFARGDQGPESDIDLIIEFEQNTHNLYELKNSLRDYLKRHLNRDIDIAREKYLKPRIKDEILREAVFV